MKEENLIVFQCACCDFKFKKTLEWLENKDSLRCSCEEQLDIDELLFEIYTSPDETKYIIYQK